jgi:L-ascorbate metabolism protein UlaG (beta-lactamase superfamily)
MNSNLSVRPIGGSTALIELGGVRLLTDPTLDPPPARPPAHRHRTIAPAATAAELQPIDVALVSHDQHVDNLDAGGRALLATVPLVLTTPQGAERLGARGLTPFASVETGALRITGVPARHGPEGAEAVTGPVTGFWVTGDGLPSVYVSGDNASLDVVREIADRLGAPDVAVLFAGAAGEPDILDGAHLTLGSEDAVEAARILGARKVVPIHTDGWTHYRQDGASLARAFAAAGLAHVLASEI